MQRLHKLTARMDAHNTGSARPARVVGMRRETHHRQVWWSKGQWTDTLVDTMLAGNRG